VRQDFQTKNLFDDEQGQEKIFKVKSTLIQRKKVYERYAL